MTTYDVAACTLCWRNIQIKWSTDQWIEMRLERPQNLYDGLLYSMGYRNQTLFIALNYTGNLCDLCYRRLTDAIQTYWKKTLNPAIDSGASVEELRKLVPPYLDGLFYIREVR